MYVYMFVCICINRLFCYMGLDIVRKIHAIEHTTSQNFQITMANIKNVLILTLFGIFRTVAAIGKHIFVTLLRGVRRRTPTM